MTRDWLTASEILPFAGWSLPNTMAGLQYLIEREEWRADARRARIRFAQGGGYEYHVSLLPADVRARIAAASVENGVVEKAQAQSNALWSAFERLAKAARDKAARRLQAVDAVDAFGNALTRHLAVIHVAKQFKVSTSTLWEWVALAATVDRKDRLPALAPRHAGRTATAPIDARAWDFLVADYLRPEAPRFEASHRRMQDAATEQGWSPIPSAKTLKRRIEAEFPRGLRTLAREGRDAAARMLPAQRRDRSIFHAVQAVNADGHIFDVFVAWEDGTVARPVMVAFQDLYSGAILSHRVDRTENKEAVRLAIADLVATWGVPELCYFDNGRHFASKWLTGRMQHRFRFTVKDEEPQGILTAMGVEVHFTTPYHGQSKPIERAFRDLAEDVAKHPSFAGAYVGNNPMAKPSNYGSKAVPIALFREVLAREIDAHNKRDGRRSATAKGRSFLATLQDSLTQIGTLICKATAAQRRMLLMAAEGVTARAPTGEIQLQGSRYWSPELRDHIGEKLIVRFDPQHLAEPVGIYTLDNRLICEAEPIGDVVFTSITDAQEWARNRKALLKADKAMLEAQRRMDIAALPTLLPQTEAEIPEPPKVVRLMTGTGGARAVAASVADADFSAGVALLAEGRVAAFRRSEDESA